jgi:hypothetical protein
MSKGKVLRLSSHVLLWVAGACLASSTVQAQAPKQTALPMPDVMREGLFGDLLPQAPTGTPQPANRFLDDLKNAPEVIFQKALSNKLKTEEALSAIRQRLDDIRHANEKKPDAFLEGQIGQRTDLQGMPFTLGNACRKSESQAKFLAQFSMLIHEAISHAEKHGGANPFWTTLETAQPRQPQHRDDLEVARVAALMQVLGPEPAALRLVLASQLSKVSHKEATVALAKMVLFSVEEDVGLAAVKALKTRRKEDYIPTLMQGLRYPWPDVAQRAAEALVRLENTEVVPQLVDLLEEADPRLPVSMEVNGKQTTFVHELVRINHHRSCMLCHAPADCTNENTQQSRIVTLAAQVPLPTEPLGWMARSGYYGSNTHPEIFVRFDVTYLRQDFSLLLPVPDAAPWPNQQRFDFLVRKRAVSAKEAAEYRQQAAKTTDGGKNPYHQAIHFALSQLKK